MPQSKGKNRLTILKIFKSYPYKKPLVPKSTHGLSSAYYIKKDDLVTDHEFSMDYHEYKEIIETYADVVFENLVEGKQIHLPGRFGYLQLKKQQEAGKYKKVNWAETNKKYGEYNKQFGNSSEEMEKNWKFVYFKNQHTDGYIIKCIWYRMHKILKNRYMYDFKLTRPRKIQLKNKLEDTPDIIYNYIDK